MKDSLADAAGRMTRRPGYGCLKEIVQTVALTLVIFLGIQTFVAQPYQVEGKSMESTLEPNQYVLVDKLTPRFDTYKRGDTVVFSPPAAFVGNGTPFIKRVIGLAGDTVEIRDDQVIINGTPLVEPYVYQVNGQPQPTVDALQNGPWTIPNGELFLMGDHREVSEDSRVFGPVPVSQVIGRAWLRYWPIGAFGVLPTPMYSRLK